MKVETGIETEARHCAYRRSVIFLNPPELLLHTTWPFESIAMGEHVYYCDKAVESNRGHVIEADFDAM